MINRVTLGVILGCLVSLAAAASRLEEITVTAQKRSQTLRDTPLSLDVLTGEAMQRAGVSDFSELAAFASNLSASDEPNSLYIRGIGTPELNLVGEQSVSYVLDGVYVPRLAYLAAGFLDVEQIEILKGPQGSLFGRNASAGVINIRHAKPADEWTGTFRGREGERQLRYREGVLSGPITERLAVRLAAKRQSEEGSTRSTTDGGTLGDRVQEMQRVSLRFQPQSDLDANLQYTRLKYFHGLFLGYEFSAYPDDLRVTLAEPNDPNFETNLDRRSSLPRNKGARYEPRSSGKGHIVPLEINLTRRNYHFTSITSYAEIETFLGGDTDYLAAEIVGDETFVDDRQFSQELRVSSGVGRWSYTAGLFYFRNHTDAYYEIPIFGDFVVAAASLGSEPLRALVDSVNAGDQLVLDNLLVDFDIEAESLAVFGETTWLLTDRLSLILGGRLSREEKTARISTNNTGPVPIWNAISDAPYAVNRSINDQAFSPKIALHWNVRDNLAMYASYTEGLRTGSFNAAATEMRFLTFKPEHAANIEAGLKSRLFDRRMNWNLSLFHTDYRDYQLSAYTGVGYVKSNAPKVRVQGVETDITAIVLAGLQLKATIGYNDAQFIHHPNGACPSLAISEQVLNDPSSSPLSSRSDCDLSGRQLHRAPRWTGNINVIYDYPLPSTGVTVFAGANAVYKDAEFFDADLDPVDSEDAYWLYDAFLGIRGNRDRWQIKVAGKNLSNELIKTYSGDVSLQPGAHIAATNHPRYFYVDVQARF